VSEAFSSALRARGPTLNLLFEQARVSAGREGDTILRDAFAVAVITVLDAMMREYWYSLSGTKNEWKHAGTRINGYSIAQILAAAVDNSRCYGDWDREKPSVLVQRRSVKILCAALGIALKKNSKQRPFCGNVCWAVLETLSNGSGYGGVEMHVRAFATAMESSRSA
jgi:hypothetical protein